MIYNLLLVLVLIFLVVLAIDKSFFSPAAMICEGYILAVFCTSLNITAWNVNLSFETFKMIIIGVVSFVIPSLLINHYSLKKVKNKIDVEDDEKFKINKTIYLLFVFMQIITIILYFYYVVKTVGTFSNIFSLMNTFREGTAYGELESQIPTFVNQMFKISQIIGFISCYNLIYCSQIIKEKNPLKIYNIISMLLFIALSFLSGGRYKMITFLLGCISLWYFLMNKTKNFRLNFKYVFKLIIIIFAIMIAFSNTRTLVGRTNTSGFVDYVTMYFGGSIELLDLYNKAPTSPSEIWGKETFYGINRSLAKFGIVQEYSQHLEFRKSNGVYIGNVYTAFRCFHHDFGYSGIVILQSLLAIIWTIWYKNIRKSKYCYKFDTSIFFYCTFVNCLWLSSYRDNFFYSTISVSTISLFVYFYIIKKMLIKR